MGTCKHDWFRPFPAARPLLRVCKRCDEEQDVGASDVLVTQANRFTGKKTIGKGEGPKGKLQTRSYTAHQLAKLATDGGRTVVELWVQCAAGGIQGATTRDRLHASELLAERLWGKAPQTLAFADVTPARDVLAGLSAEVLEALARADVRHALPVESVVVDPAPALPETLQAPAAAEENVQVTLNRPLGVTTTGEPSED